ncbi:glycosyltransferase family 4 protein [Paenibacillus sp. FSL L8-0470]|uniref:glycosyltransferase family 4 protein n=1 Tax=Paenibacillus sp. FSL L8-0470 TaxID=2954688 RepID=UPI0030F4D971
MKKILVIAQFTQLPGEAGNNRSRFKYICEMLVESGYDVTQVTSRFRDLDKKQRESSFENLSLPYKIKLLDDPGYQNTVSFKRIISQRIFAKNLKKWLKETNESFDLIYCAGPPAEGMLVAGEFARKLDIPFVIDIQDLWPEAMKTVLSLPYISDAIFFPLKLQIDRAYKMADGIIAVSNTYAMRVKDVNKRYKEAIAVYIGTDLEYFDTEALKKNKNVQKDKSEFWVTYAGSLNLSYDLETLVEAIGIVNSKGINNVRLIILGSGEQKERLIELVSTHKIKADLTGWVDYGTMGAYLKKSDLLVNAIKKNAAQSITNKIGDYVSAKVPIINGSTNKEFIKIVQDWDIGYNYEAEDKFSLALAIEKVYKDSTEKKEKMAQNSRDLAEELFNRKKTYRNILELIDRLMS